MLIFKDDYIGVVPNYLETKEHKHTMLHLLVSTKPISVITNKCNKQGTIILINQDVKHKVILDTTNSLVLLIDPSTELSDLIVSRFFCENDVFVLNEYIDISFKKENEQEIICFINKLLYKLKLSNVNNKKMDERIETVLTGIKDKSYLYKTVPQIADKVALSPSRLSHLFKQQTGMRLKNCILMYKLKYAYQEVLKGKNLTEAAMNMGFSDSAHLSAVAKATTGLTMSDLFKK